MFNRRFHETHRGEMPVSFALEFYSLSWAALRAALSQRKPELIAALRDRQWTQLLEDCDLGQKTPHGFLHCARLALFHQRGGEQGPWENVDALIAGGLDEIAEAMSRDIPGHEPMELSEGAALVIAALIRQLGKPVGAIRHDGSIARDRGLFMDFRTMFLDGVAGSCFGDHRLGENLAARPLFGLMHLDFLSWGGVARQEIDDLLRKFSLGDEQRQEEEWQAIAAHAETWLAQLLTSLRAAAAAKSDLVTLYLTVQKHFTAFGDALEDELVEDFAEFGESLWDHFAGENGA
jgi:hypothetical protein